MRLLTPPRIIGAVAVATLAVLPCTQSGARAASSAPEPEYGHLFKVTPDPLVRRAAARFRIALFEFSTPVDDLDVTLDSISPALHLSRRRSRPRSRLVAGKPTWKLAPVSAAGAENAFRQVAIYLRVSRHARVGARACIAFSIHADNAGSASDHHARRCYLVGRRR
jgi:hypothetical protein